MKRHYGTVGSWALAGALTLALLGPARADQADREAVKFLLAGVKEIAAPGVPGPLCVFGPRAFAVVAADSGKGVREPVVAAARAKAGRVVAFGHTGYFDGGALARADTGRLVRNAVRWCAAKQDGPASAVRVAVHRQRGLVSMLGKERFKAEALDGAGWAGKLKSFDVLCVQSAVLTRPADRAAVRKFVEDGGGLLTAGLGWGWLHLNPGKDLRRDHPGNRLLASVGIAWSDGYLNKPASGGFAAGSAASKLTHAAHALEALAADADARPKLPAEQLVQAGAVVSRAVRSLPDEDTLLLPRLRRLARERQAETIPSAGRPLKRQQALARVLLTWQLNEMQHLPPEQVRPHPAAREFPGPVGADARRVTRTVRIDTAVPDWHSTGLYAPPGEVVTVEVPPAAAGKKLRLRIGAHKHGLWNKDTWRRCPSVLRVEPLAGPITRCASAFGGLLYVDVPAGSGLGAINVRIAGAVEAPYYVHGKTALTEWREKIRNLPAPWAELATGKVILTVPSEAVRKLHDPAELMGFWDDVLDACADLAARPRRRRRPERYVCDVQLTAGYMHAGYPIMTHLDMPPVMVDKARMMSNAHGGVWGLFHELGHNHQSPDWTFGGTGEVTVNLFTLYVFEKVCGLRAKARPSLYGRRRAGRIRSYIASGRDFAKWKSDPFLALLMYMQMKEAFGWEAYKKVFAEYRGLPARRRPRSDAEKRDQWMVRFSRTVGRNLGPFFQAWGVPTSQAARASIAKLPVWMPEGLAEPRGRQ